MEKRTDVAGLLAGHTILPSGIGCGLSTPLTVGTTPTPAAGTNIAMGEFSTIMGGRDHHIAPDADRSTIIGGSEVRVTASDVTAAGHRLAVSGQRAVVFGSELTVTADDAFVLGTRHGQLELTASAIVIRRGTTSLTIAEDGIWVETTATGRRPLV